MKILRIFLVLAAVYWAFLGVMCLIGRYTPTPAEFGVAALLVALDFVLSATRQR